MKVIKTITYSIPFLLFFQKEVKIELIDLGYEEFCVRRRSGNTQEFFCMERNGTTLMHEELIRSVTISYRREAERIFKANQAMIKGDYSLSENI